MVSGIHDPFSLTQIIGYIGMALGILAFLQKNDTHMKILIVGVAICLVSHFILLGAYVAAFASCLAGTRAGISIFPLVRRNANYVAPVFVVLTVVTAIAVYERPIDILPMLAALNGTYAFFYLEGFRMRCAILVGTCLWLVHNLLAHSYGPLIMEGFILTANLITIFRMHRAKRLGYNL